MCDLKLTSPRQPRDGWRHGLSASIVSVFEECLTREDFQSCSSFRAQCFVLFEHYPALSNCDIAAFFGCDPQSVRFQRRHFQAPARSPGRPPLFTAEQSELVLGYIKDCLAQSQAPTCNDVLNFVFENLGIDVLPDSLRHWINRKTSFKTTAAPPMEKKRTEVTVAQIFEYFEALQRATDGVPACLVMNLDESGFQRFADARNETVIVPKECQRPVHGIARDEKRATFLAAIATNDKYLKPLMVLPRVTVEEELLSAGYDEDTVLLAPNPSGFITTAIFEWYCSNVIVPYVYHKREQLDYSGKAVLIMDGCACHKSRELEALFDQHGIVVVFLPPHSSDQVQALDLGIFGNHKSAQSRIHPAPGLSRQSQQVIKAVSAFQAIAHPYAVTSAFRKAGLTPIHHDGRFVVEVTPWTTNSVRNIPDSASHPPECFESYGKTRVDITTMSISRVDVSAGLIEDLPYIPQELDQTYESSLMRDWAGFVTGDPEAWSDDESDPDFNPDSVPSDEFHPCTARPPQPDDNGPPPIPFPMPNHTAFMPNPAALMPNPAALMPNPAALMPNPTAFMPNPAALMPMHTAFMPNHTTFMPNPTAF